MQKNETFFSMPRRNSPVGRSMILPQGKWLVNTFFAIFQNTFSNLLFSRFSSFFLSFLKLLF